MFISILGRQPAIGVAELERLYGDVSWFSDESAIIKTDTLDFERLGGSQKAGRIVAELPHGDWVAASRKLVAAYTEAWRQHDGKITLGISAYGFRKTARDIQKTGIILKKKLRDSGTSLRLVPNDAPALSTATSHHNKLGLSNNKIELLVVRNKNGKVIIAESIGSQNITAYARRDQGRPKRDAFVGMLPPKLAQIIINLASPLALDEADSQSPTRSPGMSETVSLRSEDCPSEASSAVAKETGTRTPRRVELATANTASANHLTLLDPFCGTGVVLQEASLMDYNVYGSDLSDKMIDYSRQNLDWLAATHHIDTTHTVEQGDAMNHTWRAPINAVACEGYLGQPFSAPPSPAKLAEVRKNCNHIMGEFLRNIAPQLQPGTPLCVAVPAWKASDGSFTHLPLVDQLGTFGYKQVHFKTVNPHELLYYREDQVVARELLVIVKS